MSIWENLLMKVSGVLDITISRIMTVERANEVRQEG